MFSTTPTASSAQARGDASQRTCAADGRWMPVAPPLPMLGHLAPHTVAASTNMTGPLPGKASHSSVASTRTTSPSSASSSSEEAVDSGALARRRGCKMLCLTELIADGDAEGGSPSGNSSTSSLDTTTASTNSTRCTPFTPHMMSFSPMPRHGADSAARALPVITEPKVTPNQVAEQSMMLRTTPARTDASQRTPPFASRLGGAAAGGDASQRRAPCVNGSPAVSAGRDASQRTPAGRVSLGVAVIGGDASQRSPPGCIKSAPECDASRRCFPAKPFQHDFVSTCPAVSKDTFCTPTAQDKMQRNSAGSMATNVPADCSNDVLKSWLVASFCDSSPQSSAELAQKLLAALPESYED